jgi:hypothetical protein
MREKKVKYWFALAMTSKQVTSSSIFLEGFPHHDPTSCPIRGLEQLLRKISKMASVPGTGWIRGQASKGNTF